MFDSSERMTDLRQVIETTLQPFLDAGASARVELEGPAFALVEQTAAGLALAFHELATNALKYGALKTPQGTISVMWSVDHDDAPGRVAIEWKEHVPGGIGKPRSMGFGTKVIRVAVANEPHGKTDLAYEADGLRCRFDFTIR